jgi:aquaporin Z
MDQPLGTRLAAEAVGTFLFFFLGFSGIAVVVDIGADAITPLGVAAGFGFGLALAITAFGHISGGHFNPAVSAGLAIAGKFPSRDVIPYWVAQLVGGFVAVLVMAIVYSSEVTDALGTQPGSGIDDWAALVLEIIATGLFVMVILTVATDERAAWNGVMAPFLIGLFIFTAATTVGPASGGSFNPRGRSTPSSTTRSGATSGSTSSGRSQAVCSVAPSGRISSRGANRQWRRARVAFNVARAP